MGVAPPRADRTTEVLTLAVRSVAACRDGTTHVEILEEAMTREATLMAMWLTRVPSQVATTVSSARKPVPGAETFSTAQTPMAVETVSGAIPSPLGEFR